MADIELEDQSVETTEVVEDSAPSHEEVDDDVVVDDEGQGEEEEEVVQDGQEEPVDDGQATETLDKSQAFAKRLAQKTKQIEEQLKAQYENQYGKAFKTIEREAKKYGISTEEYLQHLDEQAAEEEREAQLEADRQKYGDLPPDILEKVKKAEEYEAMQTQMEEVKAFKKAFPNIKSFDELPSEVLEIRDREKCSITAAYKSYLFDHQADNAEKIRIEAEQKAIRQMQRNASNTPGNLGGQGTIDNRVDINKMSKAEFEKFVTEVKSGQRKSLY